MSNAPIDLILSKLNRAKKAGPESWMACCPAHEDKTPSLSISAGDDGRVLLNCFAGCGVEAVLAALGLELSDLYVTPAEDARRGTRASQAFYKPPRDEPTPRAFVSLDDVRAAYVGSLGEPSASWTYRDPAGEVLGVVFRWETPNGKTIRSAWRRGHEWSMSPPTIRPLYRLDQVAKSDRVYIVEGEKAADRLASLGFEATTSPGGSAAGSKADWSVLEASEFVIVPDADKAGEKYAKTVAAALEEAVPDRTVVILSLDGLRQNSGDDIVEWIEIVHRGDEVAAAGALELATAMALADKRRHRPLLSAAEILEDPLWKKPPPVIRTGVSWFDDIQPFGGLERGSLTILAAPPRCYKTSILLFLAWQLAEAGCRVHYLAGEMTRTALLRRIVAMIAEVSPNCVADSQDPAVAERVRLAENRIRAFEDRLTFGRAPVTLSGIEASANVADVVIIDYLQLIQPDPDHVGAGRVDELDAIMRVVLSLAQQGATIIAAASLNRQNRDTLSLSAIRGSSSIEYGATAIYATTEKLAGVGDEDVATGNVRDVEYRCLKQREGTPKPLRFQVDLPIGPLPIGPVS